MKFKRDYKIMVAADARDVTYWTMTHKGETKTILSREDYVTIRSMLMDIVERIDGAIESIDYALVNNCVKID